MTIRSLLFLGIVTLTTNINTVAQLDEVCGIMAPQDSTDWGIGLIKWDSEISILGKNGNTNWLLSKKLKKSNSDTEIIIDDNDLVYAGHYGNAFLKVFQIKDTKYKILNNSIEGGIWVDFNRFNAQGMTFNTYYSMLFNDSPKFSEAWRSSLGSSLGINLTKSCLNLRERPSTDSRIIMCLEKNINDEKFHSVSIEHHNNEWAAIRVYEHISVRVNENYGEGCAYKINAIYRGWVKAIDDNGYPNIWYGMTKY